MLQAKQDNQNYNLANIQIRGDFPLSVIIVLKITKKI